jgi:hypothetical protein
MVREAVFPACECDQEHQVLTENPNPRTVSAADGRTELQRPPYLYFKGTDVTTGVVMETDPQQVQLAVQNETVCPPGSVLSLEPRDISNTFPRAGLLCSSTCVQTLTVWRPCWSRCATMLRLARQFAA